MICKKCNLEKDLIEFRTRKKKNGDEYKISWCKQCENTRYSKICVQCGIEFKTKHNKALYCSKECSSLAKRNGATVRCENCGKEIYKKSYRIKRDKHNYCSDECARKHRKTWYKGELVYNYNPNRTKEQRQKERKTPKDIYFTKGVKMRDNFTCKICNSKGYVVAHHLESFNSNKEKRYDINNGVTLCDKCHKEFHKKYGYGNNTKLQFESFKVEKIIPSRAE